MVVNNKLVNNLPMVIDYLERNPDFFLDNPTLLSNLNIPHTTGKKISSLIEYQVNQLRKNERLLKTKIEDLIYNQKQFELLTEKVHEQALVVINSETIETLYDKLFVFLKQEYQCNHLLIFFFAEKRPCRDYRDLRFKQIHSQLRYLFSGLYNLNKPLCDSLPSEYMDGLFGKESNKIKSTVSLPVKNNDMPGLFILGSQEYDAYQQGLSIHLLNYLKDVAALQFITLLSQ